MKQINFGLTTILFTATTALENSGKNILLNIDSTSIIELSQKSDTRWFTFLLAGFVSALILFIIITRKKIKKKS